MISYKEFLDNVTKKYLLVSDELDAVYPDYIVDGKYVMSRDSWVNGFYGGIIWYMYLATGDKKYLDIGRECSEQFDAQLEEYYNLSHDVGFQFLLTNVADHNITGDEKAKIRSLHAATILAGRFNPAGKFIRAWNDNPYIDATSSKTGYVIIDCMMNIPLLYWASKITGDPRYSQIATLHADTVAEHFIREDGSSEHIVDFDAHTGKVNSKPAGQGYSEGSAWTRGQSWAIYGFAMAYHYTGNQKYLDISKKVLSYFMEHTKEYVPIDFAQPEKPEYQDTSAAAITVCGILEIIKYVPEEQKKYYMEQVDRLMEILYNNCDFSSDTQAVLKNVSSMYHCDSRGKNTSVIYGDYYLIEALSRLNGKDILFY